MKPHIFHLEAEAEYTAAAEYYASVDPSLGLRFYEEMESLIETVRLDPTRHGYFEGSVRRHFSFHFPYAVLYLEESDHIWIVAVMQMLREPGYWKNRLT